METPGIARPSHKAQKPARVLRLPRNAKERNTLVHVVLILCSVTMLFPFLWMLLSSFKTFGESVKVPPVVLPSEIPQKVLSGKEKFSYLFTNYQFLLQKITYFWKLYGNTFLLIAGRIVCAIATSAMAGYAFAMLEFPFKRLLFAIVLLQLMLPSQIFLVPQFRMVLSLKWNNTIPGLIFPGLVSAFGVFFMRQFYRSLPKELAEAAYLDGCNQWQIFTRIMLPLTKTPLMALSIFTAIFAWSDLMWPLIVNSDSQMGTLSSALSKIQLMNTVFRTPHYMAAALLAMLPMIALYILFQKHFIEGIAQTGIKS